MSSLWLDLRFALRMMMRGPGFTALVVVTLALGIGASTAIFSLVDSMLLRPLPYDRPGQLVRIHTDLAGPSTVHHDVGLAPAEYLDLARDCRSCAAVGGWSFTQVALSGGDHPVAVRAARATHTLGPLLGVHPLLGRWYDASEDRPGPPAVIVLGFNVWQRAFGGDRAIIGRSIELDARPVMVVGVMPSWFDFLNGEAWFPFGLDPARASRADHGVATMARLAPGATPAALDAEIAALIPGWASKFQPEDPPPSQRHPMYARPFQADLVKGVTTPLWLLQGAVLLVLLISIVNVANLLITRAEARSRELAVRHALGASRRRLLRQLVTESLVLGLVGGGVGVLTAMWAVDGMIAIIPPFAPRYHELGLHGPAVAFAAGCAIAAALVFGTVPILRLQRADLHGALKDGASRLTGTRGGARLRRWLVVSEIALAIPLVVGSTVMVRGFLRAQAIEPGFAPDHMLTFGIALPRAAYPGTSGDVFWHRLEDRMRGLTGVRSVALLDGLPLISGRDIWQFDIPGRPRPAGEPYFLVDQARVVSDDAIAALGARMVRGRAITAADVAGAADVVVINETFATRHFPGQDPIGQRLDVWVGSHPVPRTVVGVFADVRQDVDQPTGTELMIPLWQYAQLYDPPMSYRSLLVAIRTAGDPDALMPAVQRAVAELDPRLPLIELQSMEDAVWQANARARILAQFLSVFAALALVLAAVGIYGVMAHTVAQRTPEIGLRLALGAPPARVRAMVLRQAAVLVAGGLAIGLGIALLVERALGAGIRNLFYGERLAQPALCVAVAAVIITAALLATWIPVRRATRIQPTVALRAE